MVVLLIAKTGEASQKRDTSIDLQTLGQTLFL